MGALLGEHHYEWPIDCPHINASWLDRVLLVDAPVGLNLFGRCWIWTGWNNAKPYNKDGSGGPYGKVKEKGRADYIHRVMWERHNGLLLQVGDTIDHRCRVRLCFSPHHLESVDYAENAKRRDDYAAQFKQDDTLSKEDLDALANSW